MRHSTLAIATVVVFAVAPVVAQDIRGALPYRLYRTGTSKLLQKSASPQDWALASQLLESSADEAAASHERAALLRKAVRAAPTDRLVQWMWSNASLQPTDCGTPSECKERPASSTRVEPDNAAAWLPVVDSAWHAKDAATVDDALDHMAAAKRYEQLQGLAVAAWIDVYKRYPPPSLEALKALAPDDASLSMWHLVTIEASDTSQVSTSGLSETCNRSTNPKASAAHFASCGKVARLMLGHSDSIYARAIGFRVLRASGEATKADQSAIREAAWQREQFAKVAPKGDSAEHDFVMDVAATGSEIEAMHNVLQHAQVPLNPPPTWQWTMNGQPVDMLHAPATVKVP